VIAYQVLSLLADVKVNVPPFAKVEVVALLVVLKPTTVGVALGAVIVGAVIVQLVACVSLL
jgi:high-affinity K+ transport system ATPase subunit B